MSALSRVEPLGADPLREGLAGADLREVDLCRGDVRVVDFREVTFRGVRLRDELVLFLAMEFEDKRLPLESSRIIAQMIWFEPGRAEGLGGYRGLR